MELDSLEQFGDYTVGTLDYPHAKIRMVVTGELTAWRLASCAKEPETVRWLEENVTSEDVFYDVGACVGAYSLIACVLGCQRVYAFEPSLLNASLLLRNCWLNGLSKRVRVVPFALGARTGEGNFFYPDRREGGSPRQSMMQSPFHIVWRTRMDDYYYCRDEPPTLCKIDVDGQEFDVLRGMRDVLKRKSLRSLLVEVDPAVTDGAEVESFLAGFGLSLRSCHEHARSGVVNTIFGRR